MGVEANLADVRRRIDDACARAERDPGGVRLIAVSKTRSIAEIEEAYHLGQREFGESRVQELVAKVDDLGPLDGIRWSMIGHVQTNKAADVARVADEVQSISSPRLARALHQRLEASDRTLQVLVQVNTSGEQSKSGLSRAEVPAFVRDLSTYPTLRPVGFMTIAMNTDETEAVRSCFRTLRQLRDAAEDATGRAWPELSMGMSGDLELAIAEGSTCVRVGTAIFGNRQ